MLLNYTLVYSLSDEHKSQLLKLYHNEWWSKNRTRQDVETILENSSLIFGYIQNESNRLIGFARVLTDFYKYAYIYDVIIEPSYRKLGVGRKLIETILNHPTLSCLKNFELTCLDEMTSFYEQFGFSKNYGNSVPMRKLNSSIEKN